MPPPSTSHYGGTTSYNQSNMSDFDAEDLLQDIDQDLIDERGMIDYQEFLRRLF